MIKPFSSVLNMIGNTPLIELRNLDTGPCRLFAKLENINPAGSIKDRIGLAMIEAAEISGKLKPGSTIVEATAGNTGLGLGLVSAYKGYRLLLVIPDKMSQEKISHLRAQGADIVITRSDVSKGHPEYFQDLAEKIAKETPGAYFINQFANPANPAAHECTTGPEIWEQMDHQLDTIVVGVGSGGTLTGVGRFMKRIAPHVEFIIADPQGSVIADYVNHGTLKEPGSWLVEGVGEDTIPEVCDLSFAKHAISVADADAFRTIRELVRKEGILAGTSSGTLLYAALQYCRAQTQPKRVVTFICDTGNKYLSKAYNDQWMRDRGFEC